MIVDKLRHCGGGDVVDEGECGEQENSCRTMFWWVGFVGGKG